MLSDVVIMSLEMQQLSCYYTEGLELLVLSMSFSAFVTEKICVF